jgi:hypothetical protein
MQQICPWSNPGRVPLHLLTTARETSSIIHRCRILSPRSTPPLVPEWRRCHRFCRSASVPRHLLQLVTAAAFPFPPIDVLLRRFITRFDQSSGTVLGPDPAACFFLNKRSPPLLFKGFSGSGHKQAPTPYQASRTRLVYWSIQNTSRVIYKLY